MHEQGFKASCVGLVHGTPPEPCVVILGVAGDLARTTLVPSLYALGCQRLLPEPFALLGVARRAWDDDTFRDAIRTYAQEKKGFSDETWQQFAQSLSFVRGALDAPPVEDYARLRESLKAVQAEHHMPDNVLFHFSVPPQLYREIAHKLAAASLLESDSDGWRRLIIEKPFGRDVASARALDRQLLKVVHEEQIYRWITTWRKGWSRTCWSSTLPIRALSLSGTTTTLITCKLPRQRTKALARAHAVLRAHG